MRWLVVAMSHETLFRRIFVTVIMAMIVASMPMGVIMEENQTKNIRRQTKTSDNADELWILHFLRFHQPLYSLEEDRHTESDQEDTVYQRTQGFRTLPLYARMPISAMLDKSPKREKLQTHAIGVHLRGSLLVGDLNGP